MTDNEKSFFELMQNQNLDELYKPRTGLDWKQLEVDRRVHESTQKEITAELKKLDERSAYKDKEAKTLLKDVAGTVVDKDQRRKNINKELLVTKDKDRKLKLLESHHQLTGEIEKFWHEKSQRWEKGLANINKGKK